MKPYLQILSLFFLSWTHLAASTCTFPYSFWASAGQDSWYTSNKGTINMTSTTIIGWQIHTFGAFTFTCELNSGTKYVSRSEKFYRYNLPFEAFLCLDMTQQSTVKYTYYQPTTQLSDAGNERIKIFLEGHTISSVDDICDVTDYSALYYSIMVKVGYISDAKITCPTALQYTWTYTFDEGSGNLCGNSTSLDVCTDTSVMAYDYSKCTEVQANSAGGSVNCLYSSTSGDYTYLHVYNLDSTTTESGENYRFSCFTYLASGTTISATESAQDCPVPANVTAIDTGAVVVLTQSAECPTETVQEAASATVEIVLGFLGFLILVAIIIAIIYFLYKRKKRLEAEAKKAKEEQERKEREEAEARERRRMEEGALTPRMDFGLPDESIYDLHKLFIEDDAPVSPTNVKPKMSDRLFDKALDELAKDGDLIDEYKLKEMMDAKGWLDARKRRDDKDEFIVDEPRSKSAFKRLKEMARKKKKKFEKATSRKNDEVAKKRKDLVLDLMGTDYEDDEFDADVNTLRKKKMIQEGWLDDIGPMKKKKKKKRKKKESGLTENMPTLVPMEPVERIVRFQLPCLKPVVKQECGIKKLYPGYSDKKLNKIPLRRTMRKRKIDSEFSAADGEISLPLYREDPKLKDLPPLQRVQRKKNLQLWSDVFGDIHGGKPFDLDAINKARLSENKWKLLLEELYADKRYFDYARKSSAGKRNERDVSNKSIEGLNYLYDRAKYWEEHPSSTERPTPVKRSNTFQTPRTDPSMNTMQRRSLPRNLSPIDPVDGDKPGTHNMTDDMDYEDDDDDDDEYDDEDDDDEEDDDEDDDEHQPPPKDTTM